jgi:lipid-A-disaccharide synthase
MSKACLMIVAGERSGELFGAELALALRGRLHDPELFGCGGEAMRRAGVDTVVDAHQLTMIGITEVIGGLPRAYRAFHALLKEVDKRRPQLAVLIDFPDFNLRLAKQLKKRGIHVVYFVSPQVWAWRKSRLKQLKPRIDKMLCIFDFEEVIYREAGIAVEYVGHPLVDLVRPHLTREQFFAEIGLEPGTATVALLPGSREKEVSHILPTMLEAAHRLTLTHNAQFVIAVAPTLDTQWLEKALLQRYGGKATIRTATHATYDALEHCEVAIVASGTATLEAALRERPMVVVYRVSWLTWLLGRALVNVPFYSMVNILAGKPVVPELIQSDFTAAKLAGRVEYLLDHAQAREDMKQELRAVKGRLGPRGAIGRAADAVAEVVQSGAAAQGVRSQKSEVRSQESEVSMRTPPAP